MLVVKWIAWLMTAVVMLWLSSSHWPIVLGLYAVIFGVLLLFGQPRRCALCKLALQRAGERHTLEGRKVQVCSHCAERLHRKASQRVESRS